ncbi:MAG TPA: hypothetical protein VEC16_05890 [Alphaproteobacteria bacterium]|nr:hypothetical protein [Alphaproteobacteria bacterium]
MDIGDKNLNMMLAILGVGLLMAASGAYSRKICSTSSSKCKTKYDIIGANVIGKVFYDDSIRHKLDLDLGYREISFYSSGKDAISIDSLLNNNDSIKLKIKKPGCFCNISDYTNIAPQDVVSVNNRNIWD